MELQTVPFSDFPALVNKVQDKSLEVFDPAPLFAVNVEVHSCAVLDGKYLLFGADRGLFFIDIGANSKHPIPIFQNVRFRKLQIIPQLNCLIALSGRHDHVRQYKLSSIRKLIRYLLGDDPAVLAKLDTPRVNADQDAQSEASVDDEYRKARHANERSEETLVRNWSADYIKILGTREAKSFAIEETELSTFMLVMFKQDMVLFEWAKQPYTRFMKLKAFWLPETPKFASITQDGVDLVSIYLGYSREMNLVNVDDSKVRDVRVSKDFVRTNGSKDRWRSFVQIPMSDAILAEALRTNIKNLRTVNRKLAAVGGPAVKKGSLSSERYFLATFNRMTKVVDASGQPMAGSGVGGWRDGVVWNEAPVEMILRPFQHVIAVGLNTAEIVDWKSADLRQRLHIDSSGSLRVLSCLHGEMIIAIDKKRKGSSIYLLREKTASPRPSGALLMKIREEESSASAIPKSSPEKKLSDRPAARNLAPEAPTAISSTPKLQYASPGIRSPVIPHENYSDVSEVPSIMVPNLGHSDGTEEISDFRISPLNLSPGLELGVQRATTSPVEASIEISKVVEKVRATTIVPGDIQSQVSPQSAFAAPVEKTRSTTMAPGAIQTQVPPHSAYAVNARQFMPGSNVGYSARIMRPSERRSLTSSPADESARSETASQNFDRRPSNVSSVASQSNIAQPTSNQERGSVSAISEYLVYAPQPLANGGARPDRRNSEYSGAGAQYRPQNINMRPRPQYHSSNFRAPNPQLQRPAYYQQPPPAQYMNQARPMNQHPQMQRPAQYQARPIPYMNQPRPVPYMDPARPVQYMDQPRPVQNIDQPRPMYMSMDQPRPQYTQGRPPQGAGEPARLEYARPMIYRYSNDGPRPYRPDPRIQRPPGG